MLALSGCGGDGDATGAGIDASLGPGLVVHVTADGNDAHDGVTQPVETLGRAIAIATDNPQVSDIVLDARRYTMRAGESFPYIAPPNVVGISGPPGGGAILIGSGAETGLIMSGGQLQNLQLEHFTVAIEADGILRIKNLRIESSMVGVHSSKGIVLRIDNLDISGSPPGSGICATGLQLENDADLTATNLTLLDLGAAISAHGSASRGTSNTVDISGATITSSLGTSCRGTAADFFGVVLILNDTVIDGGDTGISFGGSDPASARITNTTLRHLNLGMTGNSGQIEIVNSTVTASLSGLVGSSGSWSLTGVTIAGNQQGISMRELGFAAAPTLKMRACVISQNRGIGVALMPAMIADLGTTADPGNNVIELNSIGLDIQSCAAEAPQGAYTAVGNTWSANVQDADAVGHYPAPATLTGPIDPVPGTNFALATGCTLLR
jgi:hypothetical protein